MVRNALYCRRMKEEGKLVSVRMDLKAVKALERVGQEQDRSISWLVRRAVTEFLERQPVKKA